MQKSHPLSSSTKAFTLLEILLVVAIIAILAGIVIVAINPAKQLGSTRDAERKSDINTLYKAVNQYVIDHGTLPSTISTSSLTEICNTGFTPGPVNTCGSLTDLSMLVPTYLSSIPTDPSEEALSYLPFIPRAHATLTGTGYSIQKVNNNVFVVALLTEQGFTTQPGYSSSTPVVAFVGKLPSNYTPPVATGATSTGGGGGWSCGSALVDTRDSKSYATAPIGSQCWMQQNINVGTITSGVNEQGTSLSSIDKYCYNDDEGNCTTYGALYEWNQAMGGSTSPGAQGICMTGWHIPTHDEWSTLERAVCTSGTCATDFPYDNGTQGWRGTDEGSTLRDMSGLFRSLMSGIRMNIGGTFEVLGSGAFFWSSTENDFSSSWHRHILSYNTTVYRSTDDKEYGFSIRCVEN